MFNKTGMGPLYFSSMSTAEKDY